jgi:hypothetical protein
MPFRKEKKDKEDMDDMDDMPVKMGAAEDPVEQAVEEEPVEVEAAPEEAPVEEPEVEEAAIEEPEGITASDYHRRFLRAFRLALTAQHKNLIENPLKAAMYKALAELNVDNPAAWVESIYAQAADDHFEVALSKTDEYLELSDEALIETESVVGDMGVNEPIEEDDDVDALRPVGRKAEELKRRARASSMPFSSATTHQTDRFSEINSALPAPKLAGIGRFKI